MRAAAIVLAALLAALSANSTVAALEDDFLTLRVGTTHDLTTRNALRLVRPDFWTDSMMDFVFDRPIKQLPNGSLAPYIAKGVDFDEDGVFEAMEYGVWAKDPSADPLNVTVYYDFNGVLWHDETQMTAWDLLFSYHVLSLSSYFYHASGLVGIYPLEDSLFPPGGLDYETSSRQLNLFVVPKIWEGEPDLPGDPALRYAVRFGLREPSARFYEATLFPSLLPMHVWSRTGGGRHEDFGCAIWIPPAEALLKGLPECGTTNSTRWGAGIPRDEEIPGSQPYDFDAFAWEPRDEDVIGSGRFRFVRWVRGVETILVRYDGYFVGDGFDPRLAAYLRRPVIEGIEARLYPSHASVLVALTNREVDLLLRVPLPVAVQSLLWRPGTTVEVLNDFSTLAIGYNMRRAPWGYLEGDPSEDVGLVLRRAAAFTVDQESIIRLFTSYLAVEARGFVPSGSPWRNDSLASMPLDLEAARTMLDSPEARAAGVGEDPPGSCSPGTSEGCRDLPGIGRESFTFVAPTAEHDYLLSNAASYIALNLRALGLNAELIRPGPAQYFELMGSRAYDLFMTQIGPRRPGPDPDFLCQYFCGGRVSVFGVENETLENLLQGSRRALDRNERQRLILDAQGILADLRPAEPLIHAQRIEAYRNDRFVNWTVVAGSTLWNEWSLQGIRSPARTAQMAIEMPWIIGSGQDTTVEFGIRDPDGRPIAGATMTANVTSPAGESGGFVRNGEINPTISLLTDAAGIARATYRAPVATDGVRALLIEGVATHPGLDGPVRQIAYALAYPDTIRFLDVRIDLPLGNVGSTGGALPLRVSVAGDRGEPVPDATLAVSVQPDVAPPEWTAPVGDRRETLIRFSEPAIYGVRIDASAAGYEPGAATTTVWVLEAEGPAGPPGNLLLPIVAIWILVVGSAAIVTWRWLRRGRTL